MEELDLKELLILFWHKKTQIILIIMLFAIVGVLYTLGFVTPLYTSSTTLVLATSDDSAQSTNTITTTDVTLNSKLVSTYSELVKSKNVLRQVISNLGMNLNENSLRNSITVSSVKDTELIEISVTNANASNAAKIANEIATVFAEKVADIYNINNVHVVDKAEVSSQPSNINHLKDVTIFIFIGIVVAIMYVLLVNILDTTVKTAEEIEKQFDIPVLAQIPLHNFDAKKGGKRK